jgi:hypothetical protein
MIYSVDSARSGYTPLKVVYVIKSVAGVGSPLAGSKSFSRHRPHFTTFSGVYADLSSSTLDTVGDRRRV